MKKIIIIFILVISTSIFASQNNNILVQHMMEQLTPEQQTEFKELHSNHMKEMKLSFLNLEGINIEIKKEFSSEEPKQNNLNSLIDQSSKLRGQMEKDRINFAFDVNKKFDIKVKEIIGNAINSSN